MSTIIGFSKGLYSSWFYHAPSRSLFDCGEGCASFLGNKINAVQNIFLSHDHNDHIAGLLTFIAARESGQMAMIEDPNDPNNEIGKPLKIFYPRGNDNITQLLGYIKHTFPKLSFELTWLEIDRDFTLPNNVAPFQTNHYQKLSLGYRIKETRKRLKKEYEGQDIAALARAKDFDRAKITEEYTANAFVYSLDSYATDFLYNNVYGADLWIADTTFLNAADRTGRKSHGTIVEMLNMAAHAKVKKIICAHFSPRYGRNQIEDIIDTMRKDYPMIKIDWVDYTKVYNLQ